MTKQKTGNEKTIREWLEMLPNDFKVEAFKTSLNSEKKAVSFLDALFLARPSFGTNSIFNFWDNLIQVAKNCEKGEQESSEKAELPEFGARVQASDNDRFFGEGVFFLSINNYGFLCFNRDLLEIALDNDDNEESVVLCWTTIKDLSTQKIYKMVDGEVVVFNNDLSSLYNGEPKVTSLTVLTCDNPKCSNTFTSACEVVGYCDDCKKEIEEEVVVEEANEGGEGEIVLAKETIDVGQPVTNDGRVYKHEEQPKMDKSLRIGCRVSGLCDGVIEEVNLTPNDFRMGNFTYKIRLDNGETKKYTSEGIKNLEIIGQPEIPVKKESTGNHGKSPLGRVCVPVDEEWEWKALKKYADRHKFNFDDLSGDWNYNKGLIFMCFEDSIIGFDRNPDKSFKEITFEEAMTKLGGEKVPYTANTFPAWAVWIRHRSWGDNIRSKINSVEIDGIEYGDRIEHGKNDLLYFNEPDCINFAIAGTEVGKDGKPVWKPFYTFKQQD
jgi:hypothetical protein